MAQPKFSKFIRPTEPRRGHISERDLDILSAVLRHRFCSSQQLVALVGGNEDVTHRRLRALWEWGLINRWAFPGFRSHSELYYYLDNRESLELLAARRGLAIHPHMLDEVDNHRAKDYAGAAWRGQHMQLGFLRHSLMISRLHIMLELACRDSGGKVTLASWQQGASLSGHKVEVPKVKASKHTGQAFWQQTGGLQRLPVEPDALFSLTFFGRPAPAHFFYEADRGTMTMTDMMRKMRAYYQFIKKRQQHRQAFGIHPIRAVLFEAPDEARAKKLMHLVSHPLVAGPDKRAGLFWFTISPLFDDTPSTSQKMPAYIGRPSVVLEPIWALPDKSLHSLGDPENAPLAAGLTA